jgi:nitronate monooxygenase
MFENRFTKHLNVKYPIIMAPMFLVSDQKMVESGMDAGIMATFPSLNFRNKDELDGLLKDLNKKLESVKGSGSYGVNLIVQQTNPLYKKHLEACVKYEVPFYLTSLGNPAEVIEKAHAYGGKVYCDVTTMKHAEKVVEQGADGLVAVCSGAGGHAGPNPPHIFIPALKKRFPNIPIISAGGIADGRTFATSLLLGAEGVSMGTRFIASPESPVNDTYKNEIIKAKIDDIVLTTKVSGTPLAVIQTDYVKKMGTEQNFLERFLNKNKTTKKYFKMLVQLRGMKSMQKAAGQATYKTVFSAGHSVELIDELKPVKQIVDDIINEYKNVEIPKIKG